MAAAAQTDFMTDTADPSSVPSSYKEGMQTASSPVVLPLASPLRALKSVPPSTLSSTHSSIAPSSTPKRSNPFARSTSEACASFKRSSLLPSHTGQSPIRSPHSGLPATTNSPKTPAAKGGWRLLWRGGLEVGPDGWRLDGVTFFARTTSSTKSPFPNAAAASSAAFAAANMSPALPSDADLALSLESLRGRKFLQVRGVTAVQDEELDCGDSIQVSITSPLLAAYVTGLLARSPLVGGRTVSGLIVGLGDAGVDATTIVLYGQQEGESVRLCVGRRRVVTAPTEKKIRPGEPLPRAPRYFPANPPKRPPPPFPSRRSMSRATSVSSASVPPHSAVPGLSPVRSTAPPANGRSPGRRGEKRPRKPEDDDRRLRKAGRIVPEPRTSIGLEDPECIFGGASSSAGMEAPQQDEKKLSQRATDNKAMIRKRAMQAMDSRGCPRSHHEFKEMFGMVTRGVYFTLRAELNGKLDKYRVLGIIHQHLDMYLGGGQSDSDAEAPSRSAVRPQEPTLVDIKSEPV